MGQAAFDRRNTRPLLSEGALATPSVVVGWAPAHLRDVAAQYNHVLFHVRTGRRRPQSTRQTPKLHVSASLSLHPDRALDWPSHRRPSTDVRAFPRQSGERDTSILWRHRGAGDA